MFGGRFYRWGMAVCLISEMSLGVDVYIFIRSIHKNITNYTYKIMLSQPSMFVNSSFQLYLFVLLVLLKGNIAAANINL